MARVLCIGHAVQDYVFGVPALPEGGRKFRASSFRREGGGPAANAAVAIARLGGDACLAARVGGDATGAEIIRELESFGVDCRAVRPQADAITSLSAVMIDANGERMIVNFRGEGLAEDAGWLAEIDWRGVASVLADTRWVAGAIGGFAKARVLGIPAVLDADDPVPDDQDLIRLPTHIAFSADGLRRLANTDDLDAALVRIAARTDAFLCVTDGARGVLALHQGRSQHVPGIKVTAIDTLGAGDTWHGAFALGLAEGKSAEAAMIMANAAAACRVSRTGGRHALPTRPEVQALINTRTDEATP